MKRLSIPKRLAIAAVAGAALAGPVTSVHALQFNAGDVVLTVYGNGTEYAQNIGTLSNLLSNGVNVDLSGVMSTLQTGGNPLRYTVVSYTGGEMFFGDRDPIGDWNAFQKNQVSPSTFVSSLNGWGNALANAADARTLFPVNDPLSFTSNMNLTGADNFGGAIPVVHPGATSVDSVLNLLQRTGAATTLSQVGTAVLSLQGPQANHFVVAPIPVPAAVVLFATGLIGLIGVARRRLSGPQ